MDIQIYCIVLLIFLLILYTNKLCKKYINTYVPYDIPENRMVPYKVQYNLNNSRGPRPSISNSINPHDPSNIFKDILYIPKYPCY